MILKPTLLFAATLAGAASISSSALADVRIVCTADMYLASNNSTPKPIKFEVNQTGKHAPTMQIGRDKPLPIVKINSIKMSKAELDEASQCEISADDFHDCVLAAVGHNKSFYDNAPYMAILLMQAYANPIGDEPMDPMPGKEIGFDLSKIAGARMFHTLKAETKDKFGARGLIEYVDVKGKLLGRLAQEIEVSNCK